MRGNARLVFALLAACLLPLEVVCGTFAYHTLGEVAGALSLLAVALNVPLLALARWRPTPAALGVALLALALVPYQLFLGHRLMRVRDEALRIATFAYEHKDRTGAFPADLSGYAFHDAGAARFIQGYEAEAGARPAFKVVYRVGTPSTSHWYSSATGWGYYPD